MDQTLVCQFHTQSELQLALPLTQTLLWYCQVLSGLQEQSFCEKMYYKLATTGFGRIFHHA